MGVDKIISVANMYFKPDARISDEEYLRTYNVFRLGDIAFEGNKSKNFAFGRFVENTIGDGIVSHVFVVFRPLEPDHNLGYWKYAINNENVMGRILARCTKKTTMMTNLVSDDFLAEEMYCPSNSEQMKISSFLELLERKIDAQTRLVEHLKKYKRGALQHIFHKMTECSIVTVGDVFTKANKRNSDGRVKNVITNSAEYGLIPQRDFFDKDIAVDGNTNNYFIIKKGCFVYNPRKSNTAPYGPFNRYQGEEEGIISPLYTCLVKKADVDSTYLSWYFKSDSWYRYIYDNGSQGVRHDRVSMTDDLLMGIPIKLPNGERQKEIGAFFDAIDAKLKCEADILNALIRIKNGLYDKMFI